MGCENDHIIRPSEEIRHCENCGEEMEGGECVACEEEIEYDTRYD